MKDPETIDARVEPDHSFLTNLWRRGKFALAICGAAYVFNGSYHLLKFNHLVGEYDQLETEEESELRKIFADHGERVELGLGYDFSGEILHQELNICLHSVRKGMMGVIASKLIDEYYMALNPFYSR